LTAAELEFFNKCDPKNVPVIVIFTKFESLDAIACDNLEQEGLSFEEAEGKALQRAEKDFEREQRPRICRQTYPPKNILYLRNMHKGGDCQEIIKCTTDALNDETLKMLLVSVQQTNLKMCIQFALRSEDLHEQLEENYARESTKDDIWKLLKAILAWFPHIWVCI